MDRERSFPQEEPEDIFAEAVTRVEAGEPLEAVLSSYPAEHQAELRELLLIVVAAEQIQHAPVPRPTAASREARKQAFLQAAADLRVERAVAAPGVVTPSIVAGGAIIERWQAFWSIVQAAFTVRTMRLAPLILVLTLALLSSFSLVTVAQEAVPGDFTYPMKEWIRYQELNLSPPAQRPELIKEHEAELQKDIQKAAQKVEQKAVETQDLNRAVIRERSTLIFHRDAGRYLIVGGLQVLKKYQPDANQNQNFRDIMIEGTLAPGKQVVLEYQILPVHNSAGQPPVVQGIALRVLEAAPVVPTPVPTNTPLPTNTPVPTYTQPPASPTSCVAKALPGWMPYPIHRGDTLSAIAKRTNTSVSELMVANCLPSDAILANSFLLAPHVVQLATPVAPATPVVPTAVVAPVTPIATETTVATPEPTSTPTAAATVTGATGEPTLDKTTTSTPSAAVTPTELPITPSPVTPSATATPASATPTTATPSPVTPASATPTTAPTPEASVTNATSLPTASLTAMTPAGTESPTAPTATPLPTLTPTTLPTSQATTVSTTATEQPLATSTEVGASGVTPTLLTPAASTTQNATPTPLDTPVPSNTPVSPGTPIIVNTPTSINLPTATLTRVETPVVVPTIAQAEPSPIQAQLTQPPPTQPTPTTPPTQVSPPTQSPPTVAPAPTERPTQPPPTQPPPTQPPPTEVPTQRPLPTQPPPPTQPLPTIAPPPTMPPPTLAPQPTTAASNKRKRVPSAAGGRTTHSTSGSTPTAISTTSIP